MKNKTVNPYGIVTPKTIEEFHENLRKYYVTVPFGVEYNPNIGRNEYPIENYELFVMEGHIKLTDIKSFSDIYMITKTGWCGNNGLSPSIIPLITLEKDVMDYINENKMWGNCHSYFIEEERFHLYEDFDDIRENGQMLWYTLDNHLLREFYMMTLGDFSGYRWKFEDEVVCPLSSN